MDGSDFEYVKGSVPMGILAKELLGWEPKVPLQEGLAKTIEYFKAGLRTD